MQFQNSQTRGPSAGASGEAAPGVQAKLLRALQEREIRRVGAERTIRVNARVVAATSRDLRAAVAAGLSRGSVLSTRGIVIAVPPLRDHREDIPPLVHLFLQRAAQRLKSDVHAMSGDALTARDLPPEVLQEARQRASDDSLDLHELERAVIVRALERFGGKRYGLGW